MNYALMTFLYNFFDLGCFLWSMQLFGLKEGSIIFVFAKIGRLSVETIKVKSFHIVFGVFFFGIVLGIISVYTTWLFTCLGAPFVIFGISKIREYFGILEKPPRRYKILSRMVGFCLAPLFNFWVLIPFFCYLAFSLRNQNEIKSERRAPLFPYLEQHEWQYTLLITHQIHYFAYAFLVPYTACAIFNVNIMFAGIIFFIGWGAYNLYEKILAHKLKYVAYGHFIAGFGVCIILFFQQSLLALIIGWFITGIGGGTFYIIKSKLPDDIGKAEVVELWGQLLGMALFAIGVNFANSSYLYFSAIIFATATSVIALFLEKDYVRNNS
ncbi:MAG: hypothetical protein OEV93_00185 [Candidatus Moranbacteria bacterium]|nr:hypothetical protein [Candidatus Moranbacteria bacterium]